MFDLDGMALDYEHKFGSFRSAFEALAADVPSLAGAEAWVSEGAYLGWAEPMLEAADIVVWVDTPAHVSLYRVLARHVKAEIRRDNRFPGWRRLYHFWRWCLRYYTNGNQRDVLNAYGTPETRAYTGQRLEKYQDKLVVCKTSDDVEALFRYWRAAAAERPVSGE